MSSAGSFEDYDETADRNVAAIEDGSPSHSEADVERPPTSVAQFLFENRE